MKEKKMKDNMTISCFRKRTKTVLKVVSSANFFFVSFPAMSVRLKTSLTVSSHDEV